MLGMVGSNPEFLFPHKIKERIYQDTAVKCLVQTPKYVD